MSSRDASLLALLLSLGTARCGGVVVSSETSAPSPDAATTVVAPDAPASPSCDEVRASCGAAPQQLVRGHAAGLTGLDGARVQFAMRYVRESGTGLYVAHGVASAWARVEGGAFEACVCLPRGANEYPELAAVIFAPGSAGETSRDVARATFSQRYATLGDEDVTHEIREAPTAPQAEAALAAMVDRTATVTVRGLGAELEGARVYGGLVADERPVASQVASGAVEGGRVRLEWIMPGRAWPSERLALLVDRNDNRRCDEGDLGASARLDGRQELAGVTWLRGDALAAACRALSLEAPRDLQRDGGA